MCLMVALVAASASSFLFGYFKYGLKLRRILNAGPIVTSGEELYALMQNSMKPSIKLPFLGIFYSPACLVKVYGKVVPLATPLRTVAEIKKGHAQTMILQVDTVIEQVSHFKNGHIVSQESHEVPWGLQLLDGTIINIDSRGASLELEKLSSNASVNC